MRRPSFSIALVLFGAMMISPRLALCQRTQDPLAEHVRNGVERVKGATELFETGLDLVLDAVATYYENQELNEYASSIKAGRPVNVYLLYRVIEYKDGRTREILEEVSPHPFPVFLVAPGTRQAVRTKVVTGTGAYTSLGLPEYSEAEEVALLKPGETMLRANQSQLELSTLRDRWNRYKLSREIWKEQQSGRVPPTDARVMDVASGALSIARFPVPESREELRKRVTELSITQQKIEKDLEYQLRDLEHFAGRRTNSELNAVRREIEEFNAQLRGNRELVSLAAEIGTTSRSLRSDYGYLRGLDSIAGAAKLRVATFRAEQEKNEERRWAAEQAREKRRLAIKRAAWNYLKELVGLACANPSDVATLGTGQEFVGIQFSRFDYMLFFIDDTTTQDDLVSVLTGEAFPRLHGCQKHMLELMLNKQEPVNLAWVTDEAQRYRQAHPTLLKRFKTTLKSVGNAFRELAGAFKAGWDEVGRSLSTSEGGSDSARASGSSESSGSGSGSNTASAGSSSREPSVEAHGIKEPVGRNLDLRRPDFDRGFGSTLGRSP